MKKPYKKVFDFNVFATEQDINSLIQQIKLCAEGRSNGLDKQYRITIEEASK